MKGHLFVYGTLRPGGSAHARVLGAYAVDTTPARVHDHALYGRSYKYPFMVRSAGRQVMGDLVSFPEAVEDELLAILDEYEGEEYVRTKAHVEPVVRDPVEAWVYLAFPDLGFPPEELIESGDWFAR